MNNVDLTRYYIPVLIILLGTGLSLEALGLWNFGSVLSIWWPIFVIAFGLLEFFSPSRARLMPMIVMAVGVILLANRLNYLDISIWQLVWPIILIVVGVSWLVQVGRGPVAISEHSVALFTAFAAQQRTVDSQQFEGGRITNLFGGTKLDLRKAVMADGAMLTVMNAFGGVELLVSENCRVEMSGTPLFGGWEDKTSEKEPTTQILHVSTVVAFGGVEAKNA